MLSPFKTSLVEWDSARLGDSVYASICRCMCDAAKTSACYRYLLHGRIAMLRLFCCVFAIEFIFNPQFDLEPDYIIRKEIRQRIQRCNLRRKILSTFHTRVDNRLIRHFCIVFTPNCPFPFDDHHQNVIHPYWARPHSPLQTASRSNQPCRHCSHVRTDRWDKRKFYRMSASLYGATC